jgi:hypothetical protein
MARSSPSVRVHSALNGLTIEGSSWVPLPRRELQHRQRGFRFENTLNGEDIRRLFELGLDARDPELEPEAQAA